MVFVVVVGGVIVLVYGITVKGFLVFVAVGVSYFDVVAFVVFYVVVYPIIPIVVAIRKRKNEPKETNKMEARNV